MSIKEDNKAQRCSKGNKGCRESKTNGCDRENEVALLSELYKCGKTGSESAISILKYARSDEMKSELTAILDSYQRIASDSAQRLMKMGITPQEPDAMTKLGTRIGMTMNTMLDSSNSHLAQMVIQGANMGITDVQSAINKCESTCGREVLSEAESVQGFNESVIESMKKYL